MSDKLIWPDCKHCKQVNDLWDENNKLKKAYDEVCDERDKLKKALKRVEEGLQNSYCRYSLARESNGYGTVVWSDNLIPVDKVIEIIHKELDNFGGEKNESNN